MPRTFSRRSLLAGGAAAAVLAAGLVPTVAASAAPVEAGRNGWVTSTMARMTLEEKVGQLFVQYVHGQDANTSDPRNTAIFGVDTPAEAVQKYHLGGVIYFAWTNSVQNPAQIAGLSNGLQEAALTQESKVQVPLQIATDQEQ